MMLYKLIYLYKKLPIEAKASIWFVICGLLQKGISLLSVPIFTRLMNSEQFGSYNNYLSWYNILIVFSSLNLYYGVFNNAMVKFESQRDQYISSMQGATTTITLSLLLFYYLFENSLNSFLNMETPLVLLLFIELLVTPFLQFWTVHNRFKYKYRLIVLVTLFKSFINPVLGGILVVYSDQKDIARIYSVVIVEACVCGYIGVYQYYKGKCFYNKKFWTYAILFNLPLLPHYLSGSILNQGDRIMIRKLVGCSEVAFYSVAYNIGILMNIFISAIISSFTPWLYKELRAERINNIPKVVNSMLLLMACLVIFLMLIAPELMAIMAPGEYKDAVYVVPPVAASVFFTFMYNILANIEFYFEVRKFVCLGSIISAVSNIILNAVFIPVWGYVAAGYTTLICYAFYGGCHLLFSRIVIQKKKGLKQIVDEKSILLMSIVVFIFTIILNLLYTGLFIRYVLLVIIIFLLIFYRNKIIQTIYIVRSN